MLEKLKKRNESGQGYLRECLVRIWVPSKGNKFSWISCPPSIGSRDAENECWCDPYGILLKKGELVLSLPPSKKKSVSCHFLSFPLVIDEPAKGTGYSGKQVKCFLWDRFSRLEISEESFVSFANQFGSLTTGYRGPFLPEERAVLRHDNRILTPLLKSVIGEFVSYLEDGTWISPVAEVVDTYSFWQSEVLTFDAMKLLLTMLTDKKRSPGEIYGLLRKKVFWQNNELFLRHERNDGSLEIKIDEKSAFIIGGPEYHKRFKEKIADPLRQNQSPFEDAQEILSFLVMQGLIRFPVEVRLCLDSPFPQTPQALQNNSGRRLSYPVLRSRNLIAAFYWSFSSYLYSELNQLVGRDGENPEQVECVACGRIGPREDMKALRGETSGKYVHRDEYWAYKKNKEAK